VTPQELLRRKDEQERNSRFLHDVVGGVGDVGASLASGEARAGGAPAAGPSIGGFIQQLLDLEPAEERLSILPHPRGTLKSEGRGKAGSKIDWTDWIAPEIVRSATEAVRAPAAALRGEDMDPRAAINVGLNVMGAGGAASQPWKSVRPGEVGMAGGRSKMAEVLRDKQAPMVPPTGEFAPILPRPKNMEDWRTPALQEDIPRVTPMGKEPGFNERSAKLLRSKRAASAADENIARGFAIDPRLEFWYGHEPLRQFALNEGMAPAEYERLVAQLSSASQRNPTEIEARIGSMMWNLDKQGVLTPEKQLLTKKMLKEGADPADPKWVQLPEGYGSLAQGPIFDRAKRLAGGGAPEDVLGEKMFSYFRNKMGNERPVTVDVNALKGPVMEAGMPEWLASKVVVKDAEGNVTGTFAPRKLYESGKLSLSQARERPGFWESAPRSPGEYKAFEQLYQRAADRSKVSPAAAQALGWYGSGGEEGGFTALKSKPIMSIENLEQGARNRAQQSGSGRSPLEVMKRFLRGEEPLVQADDEARFA
jgi:hypothetical protein